MSTSSTSVFDSANALLIAGAQRIELGVSTCSEPSRYATIRPGLRPSTGIVLPVLRRRPASNEEPAARIAQQASAMTHGLHASTRVDGSSRGLDRRRGDGADDQRLESSLSPPVRRAGRARDDQRDDGGAAAEAAPQGRVRADSQVRRRAVLRRAAGRHQSGRDRLGRGARRIARRRSRRSELRLPDRSLHAQRHWRGARPPAAAHPPHRRSDEEGGDAAFRSP